LLQPEVLSEHREVAQSLRQFIPCLLRIGGHDCHLLKWVDAVDRSHQLHPILDLCAGDEPIIGENEFKRAVVVLKFQPPTPE